MAEDPHIAWADEDHFRSLNIESDVTYRSVMRVEDRHVYCAPLGSPDPWPTNSGVEWIELG